MYPTLCTDKRRYFKEKSENQGKPILIGYTGLKYIGFLRNIPKTPVRFDLNLLYNETIFKPDDLDPKLVDLLNFISDNHERIDFLDGRNMTLHSARFICYRGLMTMIASTPFENQEEWKILVTLYNGDIYMCMRKTEKKKEEERNMTSAQRRTTAWGHKFEQFMLSATPYSDPNANTPLNQLEEFSCFYKRNVNQHTIIYGAEMDGVLVDNDGISDPPPAEDFESVMKYLEPLKFVELKTHSHFHIGKAEHSFRCYKAKKTWCQCWLTDVQTIVIGFRDQNGIVEKLKVYSLDDLKKMKKFWTPEVCINFLDAFLTYVKQCLAHVIKSKYGKGANENIQDLPLTTILLEWVPGSDVTMTEDYDPGDIILPRWYIDKIKEIYKNKPPQRNTEVTSPSTEERPTTSYNFANYNYDDRTQNSRSRKYRDYRYRNRERPVWTHQQMRSKHRYRGQRDRNY